jgi:hypothetical protein
MNLIGLFQDRDNWRGSVKAVINIRVANILENYGVNKQLVVS